MDDNKEEFAQTKKPSRLRISVSKKNLALFVVSLALTLLITEAGFRLFYPQQLWDECMIGHPKSPGRMSVSHEMLGFVAKPDTQWCQYQPDTNKKITVTTNREGMRTLREFAYGKPPDTFRILLFGDSFLFAPTLDDSETFQARFQGELEKIFRRKYEHPLSVEIVPFSMGSYGTQQSLLLYREEGKKYEFDAAIYLFYQNDIEDSFKLNNHNYPRPMIVIDGTNAALFTARAIFEKETEKNKKKYYSLFFNEENVPIPLPPWHKRFFLAHSQLFSFADAAIARRLSEKREKDSDFERILKKVAGMDETLLRREFQQNNRLGRITNQTVQLIREFKKEVYHNNATFAVVNIPSVYQAKTTFRKLILNRLKKMKTPPVHLQHFVGRQPGNLFGEQEKNIVLDKIVRIYDVSYLDLLPVAKEHENTFYFRTDDHWSPAGAAVSAQYVAEELDRMGLLSIKERKKQKK